ncbi:MAG: hypothetical protein ACKVOU_01500 [Cytophagales bacterium]
MKKAFVILALIVSQSGLISAQNATSKPDKAAKKAAASNMTPEERAKKGADSAEKKLGLNTQQKADWEAAALARISANKALKDKMKGSTTPGERKEMKTQFKTNMDAFDAKVKAFLTPDQLTKYEQIKQKRLGKRKAGKVDDNDKDGIEE